MNANKKRLLCFIMTLAVVLSCVAIPNKAEAAKIGFTVEGLEIKVGRTPGVSTNTYYLEGKVNCGVDHINITLYRKQDDYQKYRFDTVNIKTKGPTDFSASPVYSPAISAVLSENMWGNYLAGIEIIDNSKTSYKFYVEYKIEKNLGSYMGGLYKNFLMRDPDVKGYVDNMKMVSNRQITIEGMVRGFYDGPEYQGKRFKPTNEVFVTSLYRGILGRNPDTKGYNDYLNALKAGRSRRDILNEFLRSKEFKNTVVRDFKLDYHE